MHIQLFMHSPFNGHLACFPLGTIMNKSAISIFVNVRSFLMVKRNHVLRHYGRLWNLAHLLSLDQICPPNQEVFFPTPVSISDLDLCPPMSIFGIPPLSHLEKEMTMNNFGGSLWEKIVAYILLCKHICLCLFMQKELFYVLCFTYWQLCL